MIRYLIKRLLMLIPVILAVSLIVFVLMNIIPGNPLGRYNLDDFSEEDIAALRQELGLDDPLLVRYGRYMFRMIQGDLGVSDINGYSVWDSFMSRLPNTLLLALCAFTIGVAIAIPMGVIAARRAGKITDNLTTALTMVGMSMPGFWLGILLILLFSYQLEWLPTGGFRDGFRSVILPAIAASVSLIATATRQTRSSMLEVLKADYLRTARAKGVPESVVIRKHALGNALIPIVTSVGMALGGALAGSAVIESVFAWPGIGRFVVESVNTRDINATTGAVVLTSITYCLVQLGVDILYALIDPRIKAQYVKANKVKTRAARPAATRLSPEAPYAPAQAEADPSVANMETPAGHMPSDTAGYDRLSPASRNNLPAKPELSVSFSNTDDDGGTSDGVSSVSDGACNVNVDEEKKFEEGKASPLLAPSGEAVSYKYKKRSQAGEVFRHLKRNPGAIAGMLIISAMLILFIISLFIPFASVTAAHVQDRFSPPGSAYPFGTDGMGRNLFIRVLYATRFSLPIGFGATSVAAVLGVLLGSHAAYYGGVVDDVIMRFSDTLASIPGLLLGMVIVSALGRSLTNLIIAVGVASIPIFIRTSRASILSVKGNEYVEAAHAVGLSNFRIIFTQVLPNGLAPIMISFSIALGMSILVSASLSFLGLGIPVPNPEWGSLVAAGRDNVRNAPWLTAFPGVFIMMTFMGFNILGDGLRDALDPKLKK